MHKSDQHFRQPKCSSGIQTNLSLECQSWQTENSYGFAKKEKYVPARNLTRIWSESLSISAQELAMIRSSSSWVEGNSNLFLVFHQEVSNHSVYNVYSEQNLSKKSQQILDQHDKLKNVFNLDWCALNIKIQNKEQAIEKIQWRIFNHSVGN